MVHWREIAFVEVRRSGSKVGQTTDRPTVLLSRRTKRHRHRAGGVIHLTPPRATLSVPPCTARCPCSISSVSSGSDAHGAHVIVGRMLGVHNARMKRLDHKLDCKACGTIYLDVPDDVLEDSLIHCSHCHAILGRWGELQRDFYRQAGEGIFHLHDGQIDALSTADLSSEPPNQIPTPAEGSASFDVGAKRVPCNDVDGS